MVSEIYDKVVEVVKNDEEVYEFGMHEESDYISLHCTFELAEEECLKAFKRLCLIICEEVEEISGFTINANFFEALFFY